MKEHIKYLQVIYVQKILCIKLNTWWESLHTQKVMSIPTPG